MSSGHASHKGAGVKQSHDTGQVDSAATTSVANPEDLLEEAEGYPFDAVEEADVNPAALERPQESSSQQKESA